MRCLFSKCSVSCADNFKAWFEAVYALLQFMCKSTHFAHWIDLCSVLEACCKKAVCCKGFLPLLLQQTQQLSRSKEVAAVFAPVTVLCIVFVRFVCFLLLARVLQCSRKQVLKQDGKKTLCSSTWAQAGSWLLWGKEAQVVWEWNAQSWESGHDGTRLQFRSSSEPPAYRRKQWKGERIWLDFGPRKFPNYSNESHFRSSEPTYSAQWNCQQHQEPGGDSGDVLLLLWCTLLSSLRFPSATTSSIYQWPLVSKSISGGKQRNQHPELCFGSGQRWGKEGFPWGNRKTGREFSCRRRKGKGRRKGKFYCLVYQKQKG